MTSTLMTESDAQLCGRLKKLRKKYKKISWKKSEEK
jgi:hypothetical protein